MAPEQWSNLSADILLIILKFLTSDVDLLRFRSVCSSWRSSLPSRMNLISFPLEMPPLFGNCHPYLSRNRRARSFLNCSTLYRLSPSGDSSDGWLIRVSEVNPNTFSLLTPLLPEKINSTPGLIPDCLNLLRYRISEICKCYRITNRKAHELEPWHDELEPWHDELESWHDVKKVIVLHNYVAGCDFAVLVLVSGRDMRYWKFGDKDWTAINTIGHDFHDVILFDGKCYAIGQKGVLVSFDSELNLSVVSSVKCYFVYDYCNFVAYKSDLYVVFKTFCPQPNFDGDSGQILLRIRVFRMRNRDWEECTCLKDDEIFLSSDDVSVGVSSKDFGGCKGNCVYLAHKPPRSGFWTGYKHDDIHHGVYDFGMTATLSLARADPDHAKIYWPPPDWLHN